MKINWMVENEVWIDRPIAAIHIRFAPVQVTPFVEQIGPKTCPPDRLEELFGDDGIRVYVGPVQRDDPRIDFSEWFQLFSLPF